MLVSPVNPAPPTSEATPVPLTFSDVSANRQNPPTTAPDPATPATPNIPDLDETELQVALAIIGESTPPVVLAAKLGIDPTRFLRILARPRVQQWIQAALAAEALQQRIVETRAKTAALETLTHLVRDTAADPVERRRAAGAIVRAFRAPPRATYGEDGPTKRSAERELGKQERSEWCNGSAQAPTTCGGSGTSAPQAPNRAASPPPWAPKRPRPPAWGPPPPMAVVSKSTAADPIEEARAIARSIEADVDAMRSRFDFSSADDAARSIVRILAGADPGDPEAAIHALWLVSREREMVGTELGDPTRIHAIVGAEPISLECVGHGWYTLALRPRSSAEGAANSAADPAADSSNSTTDLARIRFQIVEKRKAGWFQITCVDGCDRDPWRQDHPPRPVPLSPRATDKDDDRPP